MAGVLGDSLPSALRSAAGLGLGRFGCTLVVRRGDVASSEKRVFLASSVFGTSRLFDANHHLDLHPRHLAVLYGHRKRRGKAHSRHGEFARHRARSHSPNASFRAAQEGPLFRRNWTGSPRHWPAHAWEAPRASFSSGAGQDLPWTCCVDLQQRANFPLSLLERGVVDVAAAVRPNRLTRTTATACGCWVRT